MKTRFFLYITLLSCAAALSACSKADTNKPIDQVRAEAETMNVSQLESAAKDYAGEIAEKQKEAENIQSQLTQLSLQEAMGEKAKKIKDDVARVTQELSALTERYNIYVQRFQAAGGDLSKVQIAG
jgi:Skp family chaperone for outer membrane proteins